MNIELDLDALFEQYRPEYPEILAGYFIDIEWESVEGAWGGKIYQEREEDETIHFPMCAVGNEGNGGCNEYLPIAFTDFSRFKNRAMRCYPNALDPMDYACMYLELREARKQS